MSFLDWNSDFFKREFERAKKPFLKGLVTGFIVLAGYLLYRTSVPMGFSWTLPAVTFGTIVALLLTLIVVASIAVSIKKRGERKEKRNGTSDDRSNGPNGMSSRPWLYGLAVLAGIVALFGLWQLFTSDVLSNISVFGESSPEWQIIAMLGAVTAILALVLLFRSFTKYRVYFGRALLAIAFYLAFFYFFIPRFQPEWWGWIQSEDMERWMHGSAVMLAAAYVFFSGFKLMFWATAVGLIVVMGLFSPDNIAEFANARTRTVGTDWIAYDERGYPVCNAQEVHLRGNSDAYHIRQYDFASENQETCIVIEPPAHKPCFVPHRRYGAVGFQMWDEEEMAWTPLTEGTVWRSGEDGTDMEYPLSSTGFWRLSAPSVSEEGRVARAYFAIIPFADSCQGVFPRIP